MAVVYRSMEPDRDGKPRAGRSSRALGVRLQVDIEPDEEGVVHPETGGMSGSRAIAELPAHRRPPTHGGTGQDPVWWCDTRNLPRFLRPRRTRRGHALIEPRYAMELGDYEDALAATRDSWHECS